jgi:hypothetical protein
MQPVPLVFGYPVRSRFGYNIIPPYNSAQLGIPEHNIIQPEISRYFTLDSTIPGQIPGYITLENSTVPEQILEICICSEDNTIPESGCPIHSRSLDIAQPSTSTYTTVQRQMSSNIWILTLLLNL